jgi:hypothetical protein
MKRSLVLVPLLTLLVAVPVPPASAAARVRVANASGDAVVDPTYATELTLRGRGFQSIRNGHGGIYVMFGTVSGQWRPSKGGTSGQNYLTVPDTQAKANSGYAKFVAFPGSDTAGSANGGTIGADGSWTARITVPGATFKAVDRNGRVRTVDCRKDVCGVLTIGAHGVANAHNETFTRVTVKSLYARGEQPSTTTTTAPDAAPATAAAAPLAGSVTGPVAAPVATGPAKLEVDRASARPGRALAFSATGLTPGGQVSATFEDGEAAVGPLTVGATGQLAGVLELPTGLTTGTYELRLVGEGDLPRVQFAVAAPVVAQDDGTAWQPVAFAGLGAAALLASVVAAVLLRRRRAARA